MNASPSKYDLEDRLIEFAVSIIELVNTIPRNLAGHHIASQLVRSGTAPAPHYGEAQSAESRKDFIHKMKLALKELRETKIWLRILNKKTLSKSPETITRTLKECEELTCIFVKSIATALSKSNK